MAADATEGDGLDIVARHDELLRQLVVLNNQVERALAALLGDRPSSEPAPAMVPAEMRKIAQAA
jgi:hypothetical protein